MKQYEFYNYQRTERGQSGSVLTADRTVPSRARCSGCGGSAAAARGPAGRLRLCSARARGARGENLREHNHRPVC